jgi:hypothetical protein
MVYLREKIENGKKNLRYIWENRLLKKKRSKIKLYILSFLPNSPHGWALFFHGWMLCLQDKANPNVLGLKFLPNSHHLSLDWRSSMNCPKIICHRKLLKISKDDLITLRGTIWINLKSIQKYQFLNKIYPMKNRKIKSKPKKTRCVLHTANLWDLKGFVRKIDLNRRDLRWMMIQVRSSVGEIVTYIFNRVNQN